MEQNKPGKRVAQAAPTPHPARRGLIIVLAVAAALCAAYLALCAYGGSRAAALPRTTAAGVDLSGLTQAQAQTRLEEAGLSQDRSVTLTVAGVQSSYTVPGTAVVPDAAAAAQAALDLGQGGFLTQGWRLLSALVTGNEIEVPFTFTAEGEKQVDALLSQIESELGGRVQETTWEVSGAELLFHMGTPGRAFDLSNVKQEILDRFSSGDTTPLELSPETTDPTPVDLEVVHSQVYTVAQDATLDKETFEVTPSVTGLDFSVSEAQAALEGAAWGSTVSVPLTVTEPAVSTEALQDLLFRDVLGEATSGLTGTSARRRNVELSSAACDETVLLPGEVFSYNTATGSRSADKGYLPAPAYVGGKSVDQIGGGICHTSSVIYYAALNANLEIVERHNHTYAVGYVPDGMDATVWYGSLDFQFRNNTQYPIKIDMVYSNRELTVRIYGTKTDDLHVEMTNKRLSSTAWSTEYTVDPALAAGETRVDQTPYTGRVVEAYRNIYDGEGNLVSSTLESKNTYKMRNQIIAVSPADAAQYGLSQDGTPLPAGAVTTPPVETTPAVSPSPSSSPMPAESPSAAPSPSPAPSESPSAAPSPSPAPSETLPAVTPPAASESAGTEPTQSPVLPVETPPAVSTAPDNGIPIASSAISPVTEA